MKKTFTSIPSSRSVSVRDIKNKWSFPKFVIGNLNLINKQAAEVPDNNTRGRRYIKAFTLIELLVVVLIIGILAAIALPQYEKAVLKSRFVQLMVLQDAIERAEDVYFLANNEYTGNLAELDIELPGTVTYDETYKRSSWSSGPFVIALTDSYTQGYVGNLSYVRYHGVSKRECRSYDRSASTQGVCLSFGSSKAYCPSCSYDIYEF